MLGIMGARHDHDVGAARPHRPHHVVDHRGVDRDDDARCLVDAAALQVDRVAGIAVVDRATEVAPTLDEGDVLVGGEIGDLVLVEQVADQLADAAMAHDDDTLGMVVRRQHGRGRPRWRFRIKPLVDAPGGQGDERQCAHGQRHHGEDACRDAAVDQPELGRQPDADEGELAAGGQQQAGFHAGRPRYAEQPAERRQQQRLGHDHGEEPAGHQQRLAPDEPQVDMHADGEEEDSQQQAAEGINHRLDRAAVFGLGEEKAGNEGAQRHRQSGGGGDHARADGDQQRGGHEEFRIVRAGGEAKQRLQHEPADDGDHADGDGRLDQRDHHTLHDGTLAIAAQCTDQEQQRHHGKILGEQDGEAAAAGGRHHAALTAQQFHHDGRRGKCQAGANDQGRGRRLAEPERSETDHQCGQDDLRHAQPEHQPAHGDHAAHRQFHADEEQQEDDSQIGNEGDLLFAGDGEPVDGA